MAKLLLIEDEETLGFALKAYLEMKGFDVLWSRDGAEGLRQFEKYPTELCILDIGLPGRDGFSLAREIRRQDPEQPLIFLTARALKADRLRGFDACGDRSNAADAGRSTRGAGEIPAGEGPAGI